MYRSSANSFELFLSTPSARRATLVAYGLTMLLHYFYPRPPRGGRRRAGVDSTVPESFLSTPSARRATYRLLSGTLTLKFLSTPSARRATSGSCGMLCIASYFYPRPPRGGRPGRP